MKSSDDFFKNKKKILSVVAYIVLFILFLVLGGPHAAGIFAVIPLVVLFVLGITLLAGEEEICDSIGGVIIGLMFIVGGLGIFLLVQDSRITSVRRNPTLSNCNQYLSHTVPVYKSEVEEYLDSLEKNADIFELDEFVKENYNSPKEELYRDMIEDIVDSLYLDAEWINTVDSWTAYMEKVPYNYYKDAKERLDELREKESWGTESSAWEMAQNMDSRYGYEHYLKLYPKGKHAKQAIDAQVKSIFGSEHGDMPKMEKTGYGYGETSYIEIENNTEYTMILLYSGPESRRLVLSPHSSKDIFLRNGIYRTTASVDASDVLPYAGTDELTGGSYSSSFYISSVSRYGY